jgi:hypothetical protein
VGVYEPDVNFTEVNYDPSQLRAIGTELFEVPMTDQTCWFVTGDVLGRLPPVEVSVNRYGWGISRAVAAASHLQGKLCVRDYSFSVLHPRRRGYPTEVAVRQRDAYVTSLGPEIEREAARISQWRSRVASEPSWADISPAQDGDGADAPGLRANRAGFGGAT